MFKLTANAINSAGTLFSLAPLAWFSATIALYGITSIGWVLVLRNADLGKIYPMMALAFVLVPLASHIMFGEQFPKGFYLGTAFLIAGLLIIFASTK
ncbi:4-amino-4-deoxy-L-arabinose-phospho-UDP flippase [Ottowia flava]|uniref:4-amino-4-deoxy-L-arabinose-phospho-UDP flippase n=1 Tax=Ottowia flava TaxID=2675430 RepID=A0ABW4KTX9_9BURK|nr:4-amino-4-deoxy-L-arabinose-phospho-UDP flippase [Ottowia sp. GY511]